MTKGISAATVQVTTGVGISFPNSAPLNRGWTDEGKLHRKMEAYVAAYEGTMFFARPIYLDGSLCPTLLEYGILMPDRKVWCATFSNVPDAAKQHQGGEWGQRSQIRIKAE